MIRLRRNKNVPAGYMGSFQTKLLRKKNLIIPKEPHRHLSRFKTITITYELETETTPDILLDVLNSDEQFFDGIKILTIHSGYTRNPLNPEEDVDE